VLAAVHTIATFTAARRITVYVCVERGSESKPDSFSLDPGIYTGTLTITDPRLPTIAIPFTVTLAYPNQFWPLLPWYALLVVGAAYLSAIRRPPTGEEQEKTSASALAEVKRVAKAVRITPQRGNDPPR
jgi:hypothetical protein